MQYSEQCFQLFSNKLNWYEARMACQGLGGDLAALKTKDVNVSIVTAKAGHSFIWSSLLRIMEKVTSGKCYYDTSCREWH